MSSKIKQWTILHKCHCVGRPDESGRKKRIVCERTITLNADSGPSRALVKQGNSMKFINSKVNALMTDAGWSRPKTLGHFQWLCPTCSKDVKDKRAEMKARWG